MKNENKCCGNCFYGKEFDDIQIKMQCLLYDATTEDVNVCEFWR